MGPRNLLILFFSTVAVSLVILIIFFSLFFKNMDLQFDTRLPDSAPDISRLYKKEGKGPDSKAEGIFRSTVNVPPESAQPSPEEQAAAIKKAEEEEAKEDETEPVSDDVVLNNDRPPVPKTSPPVPNAPPVPSSPSAPPTPAPKQEAPTPPADNARYQVYRGGFASQEAAEAAAEEARSSGMSPIVKPSGNGYAVQYGTFSNKENADNLAGKTGASVRKAN